MKIVTISDTHGKHHDISIKPLHRADVLIHAGDFTSSGTEDETINFLEWFDSLDIPHKILIAGNHDWYTTNPDFLQLLNTIAPSVTYLNNSSTTIDNYKFWGSPYSNQFFNWAWMDTDNNLSKIWATIPNDTDIVITHGPAYGNLDLVNNAYDRDPNVGSPSLQQRLLDLPLLKLHVCGHIHESAGIKFDKYVTINASQLDERYKPNHQLPSIILTKGQ